MNARLCLATLQTSVLSAAVPGGLGLAVDDAGRVRRIRFQTEEGELAREIAGSGTPCVFDDRPSARLREQLTAWFAGERTSFELELDPRGTPFQQRVWQALADIPFGATRTYGDIARALGSPGASRAVGQANNRNPLPIVVPCHRVIGASGKLVGFGGGLDAKRVLIDFERGQRGVGDPGLFDAT